MEKKEQTQDKPNYQKEFKEEFTILVVDDQLTNIKLIIGMLKKTGELYKLEQALDGRSALRIAEMKGPDLIIMDWEMPKLSGIETIKLLKENERTRNIPVIMATGVMTSSENLRKAMNAGAVDYIRKPIDHVELSARVHSALLLGESKKEIKRRKKELENLNETLFLLNDTLEEKNQELYKAVITDSLTAVYNRGYLMEFLSKEFSRCKRHGLPLSCAMMDIDYFKGINDNHGHLVGDCVLKKLAAQVKGIIRHEDIYGRYGGEEFLLILPNSSEESSRIAAEKIRFNIENTPFSCDGMTLDIRISIGVADNNIGKPKTADQLVNQADKALYEAKHRGRNQTVSYSQLKQ
jgi:two-component system, chemotaxis family, response regulator WspR